MRDVFFIHRLGLACTGSNVETINLKAEDQGDSQTELSFPFLSKERRKEEGPVSLRLQCAAGDNDQDSIMSSIMH